MKRLISTLLAVLMLLSLVGCGSSAPSDDAQEPSEPIIEETIAEDVHGLSYDEILGVATENRAPYTASDAANKLNVEQYAISDKSLLTQEEMDALRTERGKADTVTEEQALNDIDLFFRTWKYVYPSYYFMGEDLFIVAREQATTAVRDHSGKLSGKVLGSILYDSMSFLQDDHSSIDGKSPTQYEEELHYLSFTDTKQPFDKDETGFYQTYEGVKWYYSSSSNANMRIEPTLLPTGKVAYCPLLLIPEAKAVETDTIILKNDEEEKSVQVRWDASENVAYFKDQQCEITTSKDIYYIDYFTMRTDIGDVDAFIQTANEAKEYKAVIFDLRHTQGYTHYQIIEWIKLFTGETPSINTAFLTRNNALRTLQNYEGFKAVSRGNEDCTTRYIDGRETHNKIPLIILTDKSCGSSVEEAANYLRTLENSIVIGGNTAGCAQGGSVQTYYLPHSGVPFAIGGFMQPEGELKNIDGIGYEPAIWCNPADALTSALLFLQNYGLADEESVQPLYNELQPPADLRVLWYGHEILPGQCFGDIAGENNYVDVIVDGNIVTDFSVTSEDSMKLGVERTKDGKVKLSKLSSFNGEMVPFTITYQGSSITFNCNDDTWVVN